MSKHNKPYFQSQMHPPQQVVQHGSTQSVQSLVIEERSGPLPTPDEINEYERAVPGTADRIIKMAEKEQAHRHQIESKSITHRVGITFIGQFFAFLIGVSGIAGGVYLVKNDKPITGFGIFFTSLAAIMGVFFSNRRRTTQKQVRPPDSGVL